MDEVLVVLKFALMCYGVIWFFFEMMPHDRPDPKKVADQPDELFNREELQNSALNALTDDISIPESLIQK